MRANAKPRHRQCIDCGRVGIDMVAGQFIWQWEWVKGIVLYRCRFRFGCMVRVARRRASHEASQASAQAS